MQNNKFFADGLLLAEVSGASTYYSQNDALGSTLLVTSSSSGNILFNSNYEPFGTSFDPSGSFTPIFKYTGKIVDYSSTDLYYYGARFYDPSIERSLTEDTSKGDPEDPLSLDRYIYAETTQKLLRIHGA